MKNFNYQTQWLEESVFGFPYDNGKLENKFKKIANKLQMQKGNDYELLFEAGDTEKDKASGVKIKNEIFKKNDYLLKLVRLCETQYE